MLKTYGITLAFAASSLIGVEAPAAQVGTARTGPDCTAVFRANQSTIEDLAGYKTAEDLATRMKTAEDLARYKTAEDLARRKSTADIQAIFVSAGCAAPTVSLPTAQPGGAKAAKPKIKCRFKLLPPSLICTF